MVSRSPQCGPETDPAELLGDGGARDSAGDGGCPPTRVHLKPESPRPPLCLDPWARGPTVGPEWGSCRKAPGAAAPPTRCWWAAAKASARGPSGAAHVLPNAIRESRPGPAKRRV